MKLKLFMLIGLSTSQILFAQIRPGFNGNALPANDDGSTGAEPLGFTINFFGNQRNSAFLNNNGNITFDAPLSTFTPGGVNLPTAEIIAPFFADVDTRGPGSGLLTYDQGVIDGRNAFVVNWLNVGYFSSRTDLLNSFQLVLIDRSDIGAGDFDIEFNYGQIQWETGEASGGVNGLGGNSARVGYSNGSGTDFFELPGSQINGAFLDGGPNELISLTNVDLPGRFVAVVRSGQISNEVGGTDEEEEVEVVVVPLTEEFHATIRDSVTRVSSVVTRDLNARLLRKRTGVQGGQDRRASQIGYDYGQALDFDVFGSLDFHSETIARRVLPNAGGLTSSFLPETDIDIFSGTVGLEVGIGNLSVGVAGLFSEADFSHVDNVFEAELESTGYGLYASLQLNDLIPSADLFVDLLFAQNFGELSTSRLGFVNSNTRFQGESDYTATEFTVAAGLTFSAGNVRHGPYLENRAISTDIDRLNEGPNSPAELFPIDGESTRFEFGYNISYALGGTLGRLYPHFRVGYQLELADPDTTIGSLVVPAAPEDALVVGGGLIYDPDFGGDISFDVEYRDFDTGTAGLSASINVRANF